VFEILKVFVEQVLKLINIESLLKQRDKRKLSSIGADLFSLYSNLNAIYVTGLQIVAEIEQTVERWGTDIGGRNEQRNLYISTVWKSYSESKSAILSGSDSRLLVFQNT